MKKLLCFIISSASILIMYAQVYIDPGPISGVWTKANETYIILGETFIEDGTTLIIEAGVTVKWEDDDSPMWVYGQILAIGSEEDSIIFTAEDPSIGWKSIRFYNTPQGNDMSKFTFCVFEHGKVHGDAPDNSGGAIAMINYSNVEIEYCSFMNNRALDNSIDPNPSGGAIALDNSSPLIKNSIFKNNKSLAAGAIFCYNLSNPEIQYNLFLDDTAYSAGYWGTGYGGAITCYLYSNPTIKYNTFCNNIAETGGGAIACVVNCNPTIEHNLIHHNTSGWIGGGIELQDTSNAYILNNTIAYNVALEGGGIDLHTNCDPIIENTILWENTEYQVWIQDEDSEPDFYYCDIQSGEQGLGGVPHTGIYESCLKLDPQFICFCGCDYHLGSGSPCINAGNPAMFDPDGSVVDIGSHYVDHREVEALSATNIGYSNFTANWETVDEALGYVMDVALDDEFTNFIPGFENLDVGNVSSYLVEGLEPNTCYYYRIMAYYLMGKSEQYSDTVEVQTISTDISENNNKIVLLSIYPNPVNSHTTIKFYLESATSVQLAIVDITGRIVYEAEASDMYSGRNQITFHAGDLPSGLYLCRLRIGNDMITKKIIKY